MDLSHRIQTLLKEHHMKQNELACALRVSEAYISNLVAGKRTSISDSLALLIQELFGVSAEWIKTGIGDKYVTRSKDRVLTPLQRKIISDVEQMSPDEVSATMAFVTALKNINNSAKTD